MAQFGHFTEDADREIKESADRWKIPFEFLKAIIAAESAGKWDPERTFTSFSHRTFLTYVGLEKETVDRLGLDWFAVRDSRGDQIDALARMLASMRDGFNIWNYIAANYYSGANFATAGTTSEYTRTILRWMGEIESQTAA